MREITDQISQLFSIVDSLEKRYNRHFTLDGHLIGSIGECLISEQYGLTLMPASNKGYDATDENGRKVEIKTTQGNRVAFRHEADFVIVGVLSRKGAVEIVYNALKKGTNS